MASPVKDFTDYYVGLLIVQYKVKPKAQDTIAILTKQAVADNLIENVLECFNLDTAVGEQLTIVGKYIGVPRNISDAGTVSFFGFVNYADHSSNVHGFRLYAGGFNLDGFFRRYSSSGSSIETLNDTAYRFLLKLKIILNVSDGTLANVQYYIDKLLKGIVTVVDNANMSVTYNVSSAAPVSTDLLKAYLPKPMGVSITVNLV